MRDNSLSCTINCDALLCFGSRTLSLLASLNKKLKLPSHDLPLDDKTSERISYFSAQPGWVDIQILASGWKYEWFQITEVRDDAISYLQFISGNNPPLAIDSALNFLCRQFSTESSLKIDLNDQFYTFVKSREKLKKVVRNGYAFLTSSGELYFYLGDAETSSKYTNYIRLDTFVKDVACTQDKLVYIDSKGQLIGLDFTDASKKERSSSPKPYSIETLKIDKLICVGGNEGQIVSFKKIESGNLHFLALNIQGEIYSWGSPRFGETGHGDILQCTMPKRNLALAGIPIKDISCGSFHSAALSEAGDVYTFGLNKYGQLGRESEEFSEATAQSYGLPELINFKSQGEEDPDVTHVRCGPYHTLIMDVKGQVWGAGSN
ncbi:hypothetical protein DSO57_1019112 [Entomophthora muscae]|uniref:Uncharacterized protein n=1 Tax=Entomophthora muscae TaxID=34485 RepID=A0ACC2UPR9_9FUNG|nr:hypothetical protein DSO57_1019112 [Entomophthora muscae]